MSNIDKLKSAAAKAVDNFDPNMFVETRDVLALLDDLEAKDKQIVELQALARGVKQYSEFQICHYGATEDYAKGYIDCQNNYNKVLFAAAGKGE
ncbi:TPA: hypothetical protein ONE32_003148 [Enterobacter cloacae subsp. cloacae]|nr:hypothetical protein [Enterobacter cloacae subsp. cloacae]